MFSERGKLFPISGDNEEDQSFSFMSPRKSFSSKFLLQKKINARCSNTDQLTIRVLTTAIGLSILFIMMM